VNVAVSGNGINKREEQEHVNVTVIGRGMRKSRSDPGGIMSINDCSDRLSLTAGLCKSVFSMHACKTRHKG
jgi:hypothetical protein